MQEQESRKRDNAGVIAGKRRAQVRLTKLTKRERQFAEENHGIVLWLLGTWKLDQDEYYDVVIFGYLQAVKLWNQRKDLHKYSFTTIAKKRMLNSLYNWSVKQKKELKTVSLDAVMDWSDKAGIDLITYDNLILS